MGLRCDRAILTGGGGGYGGGGKSSRWQAPVALYSIHGAMLHHRPEAEVAVTCRSEIARRVLRGDTETALRLAIDGTILHPEDQELAYSAATLLELRGRPCEAVTKLEALVAVNASHGNALASLALLTCFKTELNVVKARQLAALATAADPTSILAKSAAAQVEHYGAHNLSAAKDMYRAVLQREPDYVACLTHLGRLLHAEAAAGGVRSRSDSARVRSASVGGEADGGQDVGKAWEGEGIEGAERCFKAALRALPSDAETLVAYAMLIMDTSQGPQEDGTSTAMRAQRLAVAEKMLRRATTVAEHLVHPWLALARLLWSCKGDSAEAEATLIRACTAAWVWANPHPDDAMMYTSDIEGVKAGLHSSEALQPQGINTTHAMLDRVHALVGKALYPALAKAASSDGASAPEPPPSALSLNAAVRQVCEPDADAHAASRALTNAPFGVLVPDEARARYSWNRHLDPQNFKPDSQGVEALVETTGETQVDWGLGGAVKGVQRWLVLDLLESLSEFYADVRGDVAIAEALYAQSLQVCGDEAHPRYRAAAAKCRIALAKILWQVWPRVLCCRWGRRSAV